MGSGKTTLARELSTKLQIPFFELDNVMWERHQSGDIRRSEEERIKYLNQIIQRNSWIVEGVHQEEWVSNSFQHAELIIFLDTKYSIRSYRIIRRFILQKLGIEKSHYKPDLKIFYKMFKWNRVFEKVGKPKFFNAYKKYSDKIIRVTNKDETLNYITKLNG